MKGRKERLVTLQTDEAAASCELSFAFISGWLWRAHICIDSSGRNHRSNQRHTGVVLIVHLWPLRAEHHGKSCLFVLVSKVRWRLGASFKACGSYLEGQRSRPCLANAAWRPYKGELTYAGWKGEGLQWLLLKIRFTQHLQTTEHTEKKPHCQVDN